MSKRKPGLLRSLAIYTVLGFMPMATNLVVVPIYLRSLSAEQFGLIALSNIAQVFTGLLALLSIRTAYVRYYFDKKESEAHISALNWTTLGFITAALGVAALLAPLLGDAIFDLAWSSLPFEPFGYIILGAVWAEMAQAVAFTYFRNREQPVAAAFSTLAPFLMATTGTLIGVVVLDAGAIGAVTGRLLGNVVGITPVLYFVLRGRRPCFDGALLLKMLRYSTPLVGYVLLNNLLLQGDRLLAERWHGLALLGVYAIAVTISSPLNIVAQSASQAMVPVIYRGLAAKDPIIHRLAGAFYDAIAAVVALLLVGAAVAAGPVLSFVGKQEYLASVAFVPMLAFGQLFRVRYTGAATPLFFFEKTKLLPLVNIVAMAVGFGTAVALHPSLGPLALAVGVAAWKLSQSLSAEALVRWTKLEPVRMPRSLVVGLASLVFTVVFSAPEGALPYPSLLRWGAGGLTVLVALVAAALGARDVRALMQRRAAPSPSPAPPDVEPPAEPGA